MSFGVLRVTPSLISYSCVPNSILFNYLSSLCPLLVLNDVEIKQQLLSVDQEIKQERLSGRYYFIVEYAVRFPYSKCCVL